MISVSREYATELLNTTLDFLIVIFTLVLFVNQFAHQSIASYVNLDYFLAIIAVFGCSSILLRWVNNRREKGVRSEDGPP